MKRSVIAGFIAVAVLLSGCSDEEELISSRPDHISSDSQADPVALVMAFFAAMDRNEHATMLKLMTPERRDRYSDREFSMDNWLKVWKRYEVGKILDVRIEKKADGKYPKQIRVGVEYSLHGEKLTDSVGLKYIDGRWYWDEN